MRMKKNTSKKYYDKTNLGFAVEFYTMLSPQKMGGSCQPLPKYSVPMTWTLKSTFGAVLAMLTAKKLNR